MAEQPLATNGLSQFKATPSVDMRPAASGVDIVVRYVIRAGDRFEMRNRLYQSVIDLLHKPNGTRSPPRHSRWRAKATC